jgi:hypothetical protein
MKRAYGIALFCGALPLIVGVSTWLYWLITRWSGCIVIGISTILGGVMLFVVGTIALACYGWLAFRSKALSRRRFWFSTLGCAGLLLVNFPVAYGVVVSVILIEARYKVTVHNASDQPLDGVWVVGAVPEVWFGTVPPGSIVQRSFLILNDGEIEIQAVSRAIKYSKTIDDCHPWSKGDTTVTFESDGKISVSGPGAHR